MIKKLLMVKRHAIDEYDIYKDFIEHLILDDIVIFISISLRSNYLLMY